MSQSAVRKFAVVGLCFSLAGSGMIWARRAPSIAAETSVLEVGSQNLDQAAKSIALVRWRQYLRNIGWPEHMVQDSNPAFLEAVHTQTDLGNGDARFVFDGSRRGELLTLTLTVGQDGRERGEAEIEWADVLAAE